jgi:hypothetical protein
MAAKALSNSLGPLTSTGVMVPGEHHYDETYFDVTENLRAIPTASGIGGGNPRPHLRRDPRVTVRMRELGDRKGEKLKQQWSATVAVAAAASRDAGDGPLAGP